MYLCTSKASKLNACGRRAAGVGGGGSGGAGVAGAGVACVCAAEAAEAAGAGAERDTSPLSGGGRHTPQTHPPSAAAADTRMRTQKK